LNILSNIKPLVLLFFCFLTASFLSQTHMKKILLFAFLSLMGHATIAQKKAASNDQINLDGLKFRSIGPAYMSGRIADIQFHPHNSNIWYVAVGSGGVWKTTNAGTTWTPIFDGQAVYSIGCLTLDPSNPDVIWVGTGENVGGRHVAFGDGVYRSADGGKTWQNMGLMQSNHISKIVVHPNDPNTVWVAAQGPLWNAGGQRGVYKTTDGGTTWQQVLGDNQWVGATDLLIDPRNPDVLFAATWQRHRTVAGYVGGGSGTKIYRTSNGGQNWEALSTGLPSGNMGKIGLALSPQNPDVVYAAIELDRRTGGLYRSENSGGSWTKMSDAVSGGTGPHYYQELYACPHKFDRIYLADNYMQISEDGGKTFVRMNEASKHIDNHAVAFKANDPNYLLVGTDGGLYETFDRTKTWKYVSNLPVTQFYKIAVDDALPFYNVYGGTQDNSTQGGPSATTNAHGIRNSDWFVMVGGDGHQPATEPNNPAIVYGQSQQGYLVRHDRRTGENVSIRPIAAPGEPAERFNWDAPILVSPHDPATIYFASQRVWKSNNRGDNWMAISKDLTKNIERLATPFFGKSLGWDNPWDVYAMSNFSTITSLAASPVQIGLLIAGTDDGLLQITENEGQDWLAVPVSNLPGLPAAAFVNDIKADLFDAKTMYACFDNHKAGDLKPYFYKSTDSGRTWRKLTNGLPEKTLVWRMVQDHITPQLLFLGTEFGVYVSFDGGENWEALKGGMPPIGVRDLAIQKRENDLVIGTFGRGIYIFDDYSALRSRALIAEKAAIIFPSEGLSYRPFLDMGGRDKAFQGDGFFIAPNPPFGATLTYYIKEVPKSAKAKRQQMEKETGNQTFPGWHAIDQELQTPEPKLWLFVSDGSGRIIKKVSANYSTGFNRVTWDLTETRVSEIGKPSDNGNSWPVPEGQYFAQLWSEVDDQLQSITEKVEVNVKRLATGTLPGASLAAVDTFKNQIVTIQAEVMALQRRFKAAQEKMELLQKAWQLAQQPNPEAYKALTDLQQQINQFDTDLNGSPARVEMRNLEEKTTLNTYLYTAMGGARGSHGPTGLQLQSLEYAQQELTRYNQLLSKIETNLEAYQKILPTIKAPELAAPQK